ncbi:unnamed protein product [Brassica rapa]|uniref:Uncharacterized protein n=1 Tax=Brassica campestris TaxID=3711 RepID=A0A8D9CXH4_BRACM|nr:unnamed protein product [Brassica rapa]
MLICLLMDSHERPVCADGHTRTSSTDVLCVLKDTYRHTRTATDVMCVLTDSHRQPQTSCVCWRTPTDVLCVLNRQPTWAKITQTVHGRASVLSPKTNVLICVLMGSHRRPFHGRPVFACGHPRTQPWTSCVCWRTPTDVLCVLNRQPTWAKITQTIHGKGKPAESKDQRADMCTDGQPQTSCVSCADGHTRTAMDVMCVLTDSHRRPVCAGGHPQTRTHTDSHGRPVCDGGHPQTSCVFSTDSPRGPKSPELSTGRVSVLSPRTNVLICVLMDSHGRPVHRRPVFADGHTQTHTDSPGCPVCADGHTRTAPDHTWAKITQTVHGKGQRAESKDQRADMSTDVLCVLTDTHGQTQTATDVMCVLTDTHGRPPQTCCVCWRTPTDDVLCVLMDTHGRPVCTEQTAHVGQNHPNSPREGPAWISVLSPRTNVLICVLMDSHGRPVCAERHTRTATYVLCVLTYSHVRPVCADGHTRTSSTNVLCVLTDTHGRPVCADGHTRTSCVCLRTPTDVLCLLNRQPTWAKITRTVHGKGQRAESKDQRADMCTDGQPWTSCMW